MCEPQPGIEMMLRHLKRDARELAKQLLDDRQRAMVYAFLAASLIGKVVEGLSEMEVKDASEARVLVEETEELMRATLEALHEHGRSAGPKDPRAATGLN